MSNMNNKYAPYMDLLQSHLDESYKQSNELTAILKNCTSSKIHSILEQRLKETQDHTKNIIQHMNDL